MVGFTQSTNQHFYGQMSLIVQSNTTQICGNQQKKNNMNNKNTVFFMWHVKLHGILSLHVCEWECTINTEYDCHYCLHFAPFIFISYFIWLIDAIGCIWYCGCTLNEIEQLIWGSHTDVDRWLKKDWLFFWYATVSSFIYSLIYE